MECAIECETDYQEACTQICREIFRSIDRLLIRERDANPGLAGGLGGVLLFLAHYNRVLGSRRSQAVLAMATARWIDSIQHCQTMDVSLHSGLAGIGWIIEHLTTLGHFNRDKVAGYLEQIDRAITRYMRSGVHAKVFDLLFGKAGIGMYGLARPDAIRTEMVSEIILSLNLSANISGDQACWGEIAKSLDWSDADFTPRAPVLGMAHGTPGVMAFLADAKNARIAPNDLQRLLEGSARWLCRQTVSGQVSMFPHWAGDARPARSAWCYGDPGISIALLKAGQALKDDEILDFALKVGLFAASRTIATSQVRDAAICHGSAGHVLIFQKLWLSTKNAQFLQARNTWLTTILSQRTRSATSAGFKAYRGAYQWAPVFGYLEGIAGVGLVMLSILNPKGCVGWDQPLGTALY